MIRKGLRSRVRDRNALHRCVDLGSKVRTGFDPPESLGFTDKAHSYVCGIDVDDDALCIAAQNVGHIVF